MTLSAQKLGQAAVHIWPVRLDESGVGWNKLEGTLSADELARAARFYMERDRRRYTVARACLRRVLGAYVGMDAKQLTFSYSPYGKPHLKNTHTDIRFNVSHSHGMAVFGITSGPEIGIDIERIRHDVEIEQLAQRFFSRVEFEALSRMMPESRVAAFFRTWTCKESFLKGEGVGLSLALDCFDVEVDIAKPAALLATRPNVSEAGQWSMRALDIADGYATAVAVKGTIEELSIFPAIQ
jgi:4'-phosphopantetheinyl transferase